MTWNNVLCIVESITYTLCLQVTLLVSNISEIQNRVLEEVQNLNFMKDNSATFIERKLSFEKKKPVQILVSLEIFMPMMTVTSLPCLNYNLSYFPYHLSHSNILIHTYFMQNIFVSFFLYTMNSKRIDFYLFCT